MRPELIPKTSLKCSFPDLQLAEFDLGGVLYHSNYFRLYERARERLLEEIGIPYSQLIKEKSHLAVIESRQKFHAPVTYGQKVELSLWISELKGSSLRFQYVISSEEKEILHRATTRHAYVTQDEDGFQPRAFGPALARKLAHYVVPS